MLLGNFCSQFEQLVQAGLNAPGSDSYLKLSIIGSGDMSGTALSEEGLRWMQKVCSEAGLPVHTIRVKNSAHSVHGSQPLAFASVVDEVCDNCTL